MTKLTEEEARVFLIKHIAKAAGAVVIVAQVKPAGLARFTGDMWTHDGWSFYYRQFRYTVWAPEAFEQLQVHLDSHKGEQESIWQPVPELVQLAEALDANAAP
jgi:hypothetical protein